MTAIAIIQARMASTRLPGKILRPLAGRPALLHVVDRIKAARSLHGFVIATSDQPGDDVLADFCASHDLPCVRGSEDDVLGRFLVAAREFPADVYVRVTSDCPLTDPDLIDVIVQRFSENDPPDYHSNTLPPRRIPHGLDVEAFTAAALERAGHDATRPEEREHVTPYLYRHPELFTIARHRHPVDLSHHRWTLDTEADATFLDLLLNALPAGRYSWRDTLAVLENHPDWIAINAEVPQKSLPS